VVTHLTTNPPVSCLNRAERTGSLVLKILWSYVKESPHCTEYIGITMLQGRQKTKKLAEDVKSELETTGNSWKFYRYWTTLFACLRPDRAEIFKHDSCLPAVVG
jgi:hypothetical protein